ncbi:MAG: threonine--tRNA ligase [Solitalea-like symbiont of Tyrophagus putrescentiae]
MNKDLIKITFNNSDVKEFPCGISPMEIIGQISNSLSKNALVACVNGKLVDLAYNINADASLQIFTWTDDVGKQVFWHSGAHILAEAIKSVYPDAKLATGPAIEQGFYYDVDFGDYEFSLQDLSKIENAADKIIKAKKNFIREDVPIKKAKDFFTSHKADYKVAILNSINTDTVSLYSQGDFIDLCRGPHIPNTGLVKAFKLLSIAGAYWQANSSNKQITRIYGVSFPKASLLDEFLLRLEEAKLRDHRKLGKELELFTFSAAVGPGLPLWLPKGTIIRNKLIELLTKAQEKLGYDQVVTPHIASKQLYVTSGHYQKYSKDTFQSIKSPDGQEEFLLKPMNCPHHCEIYKSKPRTYKNLPLRLAEFGTVYRYEQSGELHGLTRVRGFTQDDAHIFCMPEQIKDEFAKVVDLVLYVIKYLGFTDFEAQLSFMDPDDKEKYIGSKENWNLAQNQIEEVCKEKGLTAKIILGEAAFYGPKLDFMVKDAIGRRWQLGTIQIDYNLPERFDLTYISPSDTKERPVMIHRAPFGSLERLMALLIEHTNGNLPLFISPVQVVILPISEKHNSYAIAMEEQLKSSGIRIDLDIRAERLSKKIRDAELRKIPYILVIGDKEVEDKTISVRKRTDKNLISTSLDNFIKQINKEQYLNII